MRLRLKAFAQEEDGAITVDWVVLTALVVGIQIILLMTPIRNALVGNSEAIGDKVLEYQTYLD